MSAPVNVVSPLTAAQFRTAAQRKTPLALAQAFRAFARTHLVDVDVERLRLVLFQLLVEEQGRTFGAEFLQEVAREGRRDP